MIPISLLSTDYLGPVYTFTYSTLSQFNIASDGIELAIGTASRIYDFIGSWGPIYPTLVYSTTGSSVTSFTTVATLNTSQRDVTLTDSENSYIVAGFDNTLAELGQYAGLIEKYTHTHSLAWSFKYSAPPTGYWRAPMSVALDTSNNLYVGSFRVTPTTGSSSTYSIVKLTKGGTMSWRKDTGKNIFAVDFKNSNLYALGLDGLIKVDSNGITTKTFSSIVTAGLTPDLSNPQLGTFQFRLKVDNNDAAYCLYLLSTDTNYRVFTKVNSSDQVVYTKSLGTDNICSFDIDPVSSIAAVVTSNTCYIYDPQGSQLANLTSTLAGYTVVKFVSPHFYFYRPLDGNLIKMSLTYSIT